MKRGRFSEEQIVGILKEQKAVRKNAELAGVTRGPAFLVAVDI